jgi:transcriptional regulator GlxA family with amidase domain
MTLKSLSLCTLTALVAAGAALAQSAPLPNAAAKARPGAPAASGKTVYVCPPCGQDCDQRTYDKPGVCPHCGMRLVAQSEVQETKSATVAILLFNGVEIIDYSGPWEVFGAAGFVVHTVAPTSDPIKTAYGQRVLPDYALENAPRADIVVVPGGSISGALNDSRIIRWIQARSRDSQHVISVCNGAFLLAKAGVLDGLSATTVRGGIDQLVTFAPKTKVVRGQRYVDNGKVITTAGLSAGIDGALHLVSKIKGKEAARSTASSLEYRWYEDSH